MTTTKCQANFRTRVEIYSARHICNAIGCSLPSAYDWRAGRRAPPAWLQDKILAEIASYHPLIRYDDNSASAPTPL